MGRGSAEWVVVGVLVAVHCCSLLASSATLAVGDTQGWTIGPNYATWAAGHTFAIGDVLFFAYVRGGHDVVEVDKAGYDACSAANAIGTYTEGNTNVTLTSSGAHYFLCSFPSHCSAGMKLAVTVGAGITPAPAPTTSVGTPPPTPAATVPAPATVPSSSAPTPTNTTPVASPVSAPAPSPVSAATPTPTPSSASTPTPTPAPTPLSPSPASTATPASSPPSPPSASTPSTTSAPPPSAAPSLLSSVSLGTAVVVCVSAAFLAL